MNTRLRCVAVLAAVLSVLLIFSAQLGSAQGISTGSISGTVYDQQKAVVPGAKVTAVQTETGSVSTTKTTGEGYFLIANLPIGTYTLTIEAPQFSSRKVSNVEVTSGQTHNIGGQQLNVGASTESITVEAAAPLVETESAPIGGADRKSVVEGESGDI